MGMAWEIKLQTVQQPTYTPEFKSEITYHLSSLAAPITPLFHSPTKHDKVDKVYSSSAPICV